MLGRERGPAVPAPGHEPSEKRVNTVEVTCAATGPEQPGLGDDHTTWHPYTLADVEAWCADLRRRGAGDDLVLDQADGLVVTLDMSG